MPNSGPRILTFALENWPHCSGPATRASTPKVRTGCVTCKRRRIKCDEAKPSCQNCLKRRVACEGYHPPPPAAITQQQQQQQQQLQAARLIGSPALLLVEPSYQGLVFETQLQKDHFDRWLSFAADVLVFPSELVTGTIPQIARVDPAVRNAALAIGAAALGGRNREDRIAGRGAHHADALRYYNRALALTARPPPPTTTTTAAAEAFPGVLVTCLLFFMFEALRGNRRAALVHLNHGNKILDHHDRRGASTSGARAPPLVEAVASNFQRLTLQSWSHNGDHPGETAAGRAPWCCRGRRERYAVDEMPNAFGSLDEARRWWETTQHHVVHRAPILIGFRVQGTGNKAPSFPPNRSLPIPPEQVKAHGRFIEGWRARFGPLLEAQARRGAAVDDRERLGSLGLRIQSTYLSIPTSTANYTDAEALARTTPAFRRCVDLCDEFLRLQERLTMTTTTTGAAAGETFTMNSNCPTWPLGAAAMLCLDKGVQADALRLLREFPRRDGLWDTRVFVGMLQSYRADNLGTAGLEGGGGENEGRHRFDVEVVYEEESVRWIKKAEEDPSGVVVGGGGGGRRGELEHRISLP
ncbi:hypothetical protein LY76DRAFT_187193 [Colletotrichum caudatum]|nr:hypothetical protein LY76DRAFT_187193 [Colletotrichum caudatum]